MNYELAKQLNDAGFWDQSFIPNRRWDLSDYYWNPNSGDERMEREKIWIPTLSELIEACKIFDKNAQFSLYGRAENRWEATGIFFQVFGALLVPNLTTIGSTPEEAVAKLWLALKKE